MQNETLKVRLTKAKLTPGAKYSIGEIVDVKEVKGDLVMVRAPMIKLEEDDYEAILDKNHALRFLRSLNGAN